jgi:hypothetical protein
MQKSYYAIIPANVRYDSDLTPNAKLLYGEITALCNEKGYCWAGNSYFSELYNVSKKSVSTWINQLVDKGYVSTEIIYKEGSKEILHRYLRILLGGMEENVNTPMEEKVKDNNTSFNTTTNNTKEYKKTSRHKFETCDKEMAELLFTLILENNENAKQPNVEKWASEIRIMREQDKRTEEQIRYLIEWSQQDSFWKSNILSPAKLRKHFDTLVMRVKEDISRQYRQPKEKGKPRAYQSLQDWADEA